MRALSWTFREEGGFCLHQRLTAHLLLELATCAPHNSSLPSLPCTSTRGPSSHGVLHVPTFPGLRTPGGKAGLPFLPNTTVPSSQHRPLPWPPTSEILQGRNRRHPLVHKHRRSSRRHISSPLQSTLLTFFLCSVLYLQNRAENWCSNLC